MVRMRPKGHKMREPCAGRFAGNWIPERLAVSQEFNFTTDGFLHPEDEQACVLPQDLRTETVHAEAR